MKTLGTLLFAIVLTMSPVVIVNAQTSSPAAATPVSASPDVAKKIDLQRMQNGLERKMDKAAAQQSAQLAELARQQAEAQRKADAALSAEKLNEQAQQQAEAQRKAEEAAAAATQRHLIIGGSIIFTLACVIVTILVLRKKNFEGTATPLVAEATVPETKIPDLPENANGEQLNDHIAEYPALLGTTLPYVAIVAVPDPTNPQEKISRTVRGEVQNFGAATEVFVFGTYRNKRKSRYDAAKLRAVQELQSIHQVA